jgi:RNA polymerase sigma factor for flagellar operon FliA
MPKPNVRVALTALVPLICEITRSICFRNRVSPDEREDFESYLFATFLGGDCRVLERYRGEGSLAGYLRVAICRLLLDYRARQWGRWRPSARATRLGAAAVELERLIERDGCTRWEAVRHLRVNRGVERSELELLDLAAQLRGRPARRFEGEEALAGLASEHPEDRTADRFTDREAAGRVRRALRRALAEIAPADRDLLTQHFASGLSVAEIARRSGADQRRLYRRLERVLLDLRARLETRGVDRALVRSVLAAA